MKRNGMLPWVCLTLGAASLFLGGCKSTVHVTDSAESGTQQLLMNSSADAVICSFDFSPLANRLCFLDTTGLGNANTGYLPYRIREQMGSFGVLLAETRDEAEVIVEAGLAAYGTDSRRDTLGITDVNQLPDIYLCVDNVQYGVAKLSLFAREKKTGAVIWHSGIMRADSYQDIRKVLGTGPRYTGTIQHSGTRVGR
ncbi:hypothetical protein DTL42_03280 [Bremerella cremea]|uniref:Lipoprotein n=1 Tax=Bremerella cremea TaxID=1031537 RepID=A0A368KX08_9BACT|nr:DUF6655 family protein [Bremerella cremea]RCS54185.1 hypothetical protein DTL42_03280 [Bremerella cremea]